MCLILLMSLMAVPVTRNFFGIYLAVGVVVYFLYGIRHSRLTKGPGADAGGVGVPASAKGGLPSESFAPIWRAITHADCSARRGSIPARFSVPVPSDVRGVGSAEAEPEEGLDLNGAT